MKVLLLCFTLLAFACGTNKSDDATTKVKKGKGTYKGNVFWKYNDYVGNKPDAGASVILYDIKDTSKFYIKKTDVRGDFIFDSIPEGVYLSVTESRNTKASPDDHFEQIYYNAQSLYSITGYDFNTFVAGKRERVRYLDSIAYHAYTNHGARKAATIHDNYKDSVRTLCEVYIKELPLEIRRKIGILTPYSNKVHYDLIALSANEVENKVIDFGITYF